MWRKMRLENTLFRAAVKFSGPLLHLIYPRVTILFGAQSRKVYRWTQNNRGNQEYETKYRR